MTHLRARALALVLSLVWLDPAPGAAQGHAHAPLPGAPEPAAGMRLGAAATGLLTRAAPALAGKTYTEAYVTQPVVGGHAWALGGRLTATGMLNLEGLTLGGGELTAGMWGEGYVDRRHPHTYLHEFVVSAHASVTGTQLSLSAGRGFAPFGTDDPMVRPFVKFPLNHHLAQLPERQLVIGAVRRGGAILEAGVFTAAEPLDPGDSGSLDGITDSWAVRVTLLPATGIEVQASAALLAGDPLTSGTGLDHAKYSLSARAARTTPLGSVYALVEWARTDERQGERRVYTFESVLGEVAAHWSAWGAAARMESSSRPEEDRLADPFRAPHPHDDSHLLGLTRWLVLSGRVERAVTLGPLRGIPFVESSWQRVEEVSGSIYDPAEQYGSHRQWHLSLGLQLGAGMHHERMGRYGVARTAAH